MEDQQNENRTFFDRRHLNPVKRWWIDIDKTNFILIISLMIFGLMMAFISSPAVAERISTGKFFFVKKQIIFVVASIFIITFISFFTKPQIKLMAISGFFTCLILLFLVLFFGSEAKGAKRWIMLFGFNLQPSEFAKVFFLVANAYLLTNLKDLNFLIKYGASTAFYAVIATLLILQPDFGMTLVFTALWLIQLFVFGLPMFLIVLCGFLGIAGAVAAYWHLPHVADRINRFLNLDQANYQVERSIDAYVNGGFFGTGPGNGIVKQYIPDAHTDFIFAVVAEEFGLISCLFLMVVLFFIIGRIIKYSLSERDLFVRLAVIGLASQIALQSLVNIAVSVGMLPTKGMTIPFVSYGGSSLVAASIGFGIILALTRKKYEDKIKHSNLLIN